MLPEEHFMDASTNIVKEKYAETARAGLSSEDSGIHAVAEAFGYSSEELASIPAESNMGLSCGNPIATAHLRPGEVVVDLGSGGGLDVFLAAKAVGPTGKAIGIDMTPDMLELARANAEKGGYKNVEFLEGEIESLPLPDESADIIISNCVINLASDKNAVFREMIRVLKPGGRIAISDMATRQELPDELANNAAALVGCIAGAISMSEYERGLKNAGFREVYVQDSGVDITAYAKAGASACCAVPAEEDSGADCCGPPVAETSCCFPEPSKPMHKELGEIFERYDINAYVASVKVFALKGQ